MFDLDDTPAYAGQTSNLRSRLRQHFVRQDSSVSSYGRLDLWDLATVKWWVTDKTDSAEQELLADLNPYLNFTNESTTQELEDTIDTVRADGSLALMSDDELSFRRQPYNRVKQKTEHINRLVDKIKFANHSENTRQTLYEHKRILEQNLQDFLGVDEFDD